MFCLASKFDPRNRDAWHQLGQLHLKHKEPDHAINAYSRLIAIDPKDAPAWLCRGLAHADRGDIARARHDVERALAIDPRLGRDPVPRGKASN